MCVCLILSLTHAYLLSGESCLLPHSLTHAYLLSGELCKRCLRNIPGCTIDIIFADDGSAVVQEVQAASDQGFDIILMDNIMKEMHGPEAARIIRASGFTGLIIGVTGNVNESDLDDYLRAGADFVLAKPPRQPDIQAILEKVLLEQKPKVFGELTISDYN